MPDNLDNIIQLIGPLPRVIYRGSQAAREYRKSIDTAGNEADVMQSHAPRVLPTDAVRRSDTECTTTNQQWIRQTLS